jgi:hypothetical protein
VAGLADAVAGKDLQGGWFYIKEDNSSFRATNSALQWALGWTQEEVDAVVRELGKPGRGTDSPGCFWDAADGLKISRAGGLGYREQHIYIYSIDRYYNILYIYNIYCIP